VASPQTSLVREIIAGSARADWVGPETAAPPRDAREATDALVPSQTATVPAEDVEQAKSFLIGFLAQLERDRCGNLPTARDLPLEAARPLGGPSGADGDAHAENIAFIKISCEQTVAFLEQAINFEESELEHTRTRIKDTKDQIERALARQDRQGRQAAPAPNGSRYVKSYYDPIVIRLFNGVEPRYVHFKKVFHENYASFANLGHDFDSSRDKVWKAVGTLVSQGKLRSGDSMHLD
jgi:hypothetical protein